MLTCHHFVDAVENPVSEFAFDLEQRQMVGSITSVTLEVTAEIVLVRQYDFFNFRAKVNDVAFWPGFIDRDVFSEELAWPLSV